MEQRRGLSSRIDIGAGLISATVVIIALAIFSLQFVRDSLGLMLLIVALAVVLTAVLWTLAIRNNREEGTARRRLQAEHPGALVERVRLWSLPHGRIAPGTPLHFVIADASEISFETIDQTVLLRIPVSDLGFVDLVKAKGDRSRDRALTLIYGDDQLAVQVFTVTYSGLEKLRARVRTAIGWPADGTP